MVPGLAHPVRLFTAAALAVGVCLVAAPDAEAAATKRLSIRLPSEGNMSVTRVELRAVAILRRGRLPAPRLRIRRGRAVPRDVSVVASVRRRARRGRFTAFIVVVNPASSARSFASQDGSGFFELVGEVLLPRRNAGEIRFEVNAATSKSFPNVLNENSARAERLAEQLLPPALRRCRAIKERVQTGSCRLQ